MAVDMTISIPEAQLTNFEKFVNPAGGNDSDADKEAAVKTWIQNWVNEQLWMMARNNAVAAVEDPTV